MTDPAKVTSVRKVRSGATRRAEPGTTTPAELTVAQAARRWKHLAREIASLPWSSEKVPDDMLRDFLQAAVGEIEQIYGSQASSKASEVLGISLAERGVETASFNGAWDATPARLQVEYEVREIGEDAGQSAPGIEFGMDVPAEATESEIREALGEWEKQPHQQTRLVLDPAAQLPASSMRALISQVEHYMGDPANTDNQFDTLLSTAALLILWKEMEERNAALSDFVLSGLTVGDEAVAADKSVIIRATRLPLDPGPDNPVNDGETKSVSVRYKHS